MHQCPHCEYQSPYVWNLKRHLKVHENGLVHEEENSTCCKFCLKEFSNKYNRKRHETKCQHNDAQSQEISPKVAFVTEAGGFVTKSGGFVTDVGGFVTESGDFVTDHYGEDSECDNTDYSCPLCDKKLSNKKSLKEHTKACKGICNPLQCHICKQVFKYRMEKCRHVKKCLEAANKSIVEVNDKNPQDSEIHRSNHNQVIPSHLTQQNVQNGNIINNNYYIVNTTNNTNNINVNALGTEDLTDIMNPEYLGQRAYEINGRGIYQMIKDVHFNDAKPENHNIRLLSRKRKKVKVKHQDGWHIQDNGDILSLLISKYKRIIQTYLSEPGTQARLKHESDYMQIQQNLLKFNEQSNPKFYFECAHKVLALIEDLELNYGNRNRNDILQIC